MDIEILNEANDIQRKIDICKDRIKKYERNRKVNCIKVVDTESPSDITQSLSMIVLNMNGRGHQKEKEAYQETT